MATDEPAKPIRPLPEAFAGAGLGLLAGLLLGLSVSQVVGGFVAALSALLAGFLGLTAAPGTDRAWRIGAFGLACAAGVLIGLAIRSGALLAPSVDEDVREWQRAGYPTEQALAYVAFARLGVKPQGATVTAAPAPAPAPTFCSPTRPASAPGWNAFRQARNCASWPKRARPMRRWPPPCRPPQTPTRPWPPA